MDKDKPIQYHNLIVLTDDVAKALYDYLKHEYISYEHHPKVIQLIFTLREKFHNG